MPYGSFLNMHILVIDRDQLANQLISSRLAAQGHVVTLESQKQTALDRLKDLKPDCILLDPNPLADARPIIVQIWKNTKTAHKPYILLLGKEEQLEGQNTPLPTAMGANDRLLKPLDVQVLDEKINNALRLQNLAEVFTAPHDLRSEKGILGKNAFYQLFLSSLDRAFRYNEQSFITLITVRFDGDQAANLTADALDPKLEKLIEKLAFMRRQSDVIGHIAPLSFAILMQRPLYLSEPLDAINRFAETLAEYQGAILTPHDRPIFTLELLELPSGHIHQRHHLS
jgi:DNA-binding response OmpR family regulator